MPIKLPHLLLPLSLVFLPEFAFGSLWLGGQGVGIPIPGGELNLSGATWNPETRTLWVIRQNRTLWEVGFDAGPDTFRVIRTLVLPSGTGGDLESCTQADFARDEIYTLSETQGRLARTVGLLDTAIVTKVWNLEVSNNGHALPRETASGDGAEGLAFAPDTSLLAAGFRFPDGSTFTGSTRGMGGLIFVAHQVHGRIHVFDVNPDSSEDFVNHGSFLTSDNETCGLEFDRSMGRMYIWHDPSNSTNSLEVSTMSSNASVGVLDALEIRDLGTPVGNFEGIAIVSQASCGDYGSGPHERTLFLLQDGGEPNLVAFSGVPCSTAVLDVRDPVGGAADWPQPVVHPNPSDGNPTLTLTLRSPGRLKVSLYDVRGRLVRRVTDEFVAAAGTYRFALAGEAAHKLPVGLYYFRAETPAGEASGRVIVID